MKCTASVLGIVAAAALSVAAPVANAAIFLGLQQDAGPIQPVVPISSGPGFAINLSSFGQFESVALSGFGQRLLSPPNLIIDTATVANSTGSANAGTLKIYVTSTGNTALTGSVKFTSDATALNLTSGWAETVQTYLDPANGTFTTPTLLGQASFSSTGSDSDIAIRNAGSGPYSLTTVITLVAPTFGTSNTSSGINGAASTVPVPEPGSLALLGSALVGLGVMAGRRSRRKTA